MTFSFQAPIWLWVLLVLPPCVAVGLVYFRTMSLSRRLSAVLLRMVLIGLLVAMLAGVSSIRTSDRVAVVAVVDVSGSVTAFASQPAPLAERVRAYLRSAAGARGREDLLGVVVFDGTTTAIAAPQPGRGKSASPSDDLPTDLLQRTWETVTPEPGATNIAAALRLAGAMLPSDAAGRILLFSDGVQTTGDAAQAAQAIAARVAGGAGQRTPIDVVPARYAAEREVMVTGVDLPSRAAAGAVVEARVSFVATQPVSGTLRLLQGGVEVNISGARGQAGRRITLPAGTSTVLLNVPLDAGRVHRVEAFFEPDAAADGTAIGDTIAANNTAQGVTLTPGTGEILLVRDAADAGAGPSGRVLLQTLIEQGLNVKETAPGGVPTDLVQLQAYDAVILQNASADAIGPLGQAALQRFVTELGGGLVMIGGTNSFGAGTWRSTPIEPILPVKLDLPERLVVPSAAVIIVMDTSGSMGWSVLGSSRTQQEIANEGAALAIRTLHKDDLVGVIEFNSRAAVVVPLQKNTTPEATARAVLSLSPNGGTNLPPAMREALEQLEKVEAKIKHVIVLTDGMSQGKGQLPGLADQYKAAGIALSTIAVGDRADTEMMEQIADRAAGTYYRVTDPNQLPRIFLRAVQVVRQPMIREEPFVPVMGAASPITAGMPAEIPPLKGLVLTQPRPAEENGLPTGVTYSLLSPSGEPVLASWQAGLGQVVAFTSDADNWAEAWLQWPGYRQMWTQLVRSIAKPESSRSGELTLKRDGESLVATLELTDAQGRPKDGVTIPARAFAPDGTRTELKLTQIGPGVYEGRTPAPAPGNYLVTASPREGGVALPPIVGASVVPLGDEFRVLRSDDALLARIAAVSGGRVLELTEPEKANLYDRRGVQPVEARLPLWPVLIFWALAAFVLDVATRRVAWDRLISRKFGATLLRDVAAATQDRSRQAAERTAALRQAEERSAKVAAEAPAATLGSADAQRVIEEARARRVAERKAAARETQTQAKAPTAAQPVPPAQPGPAQEVKGDEAQPGETAFQAAKRRARERLE